MKAYMEQSDRQKDNLLDSIQKRKMRQVSDDTEKVMSTEYGRRFIYWLIWGECGLTNGVADTGIKDGVAASMHSWLQEGRRLVGMDLLNHIKDVAPSHHIAMLHEQLRELQNDLALEINEKLQQEDES